MTNAGDSPINMRRRDALRTMGAGALAVSTGVSALARCGMDLGLDQHLGRRAPGRGIGIDRG